MTLTIYRLTGHFITTTLPQGRAAPFHLPKHQSKTLKSLLSFSCAFFCCFFVFFVLFVPVNDREKRVESQQTNLRDYGSPKHCNQLFTFARCWLFRKCSFPLLSPPYIPPYPSLSLSNTHTHTHMHTHTHTFQYAKELLQGKFSQTLMASDCSLATPAF